MKKNIVRMNDDPVSKWMTQDVICIKDSQRVKDAVTILDNHTIFGIPVVDKDDHFLGLMSKTVIMNHISNPSVFNMLVTEIMMTDSEIISPEQTIEEASNLKGGCLPVVNYHGVLVGIMTRTDIIRANASLLEKVEQDIDSADTLNLVLNSAYEGIVVVNADGVIQEINEAYCQIINKKREDVIGLNVVDVIENTRLDIIAQTGVEERGHIQRISGMDLVVHRIPIMKNNKPVGAIGMLIFKNISEMQDIYSRVNLNINYQKNSHKDVEDGILSQIIGSAPLIIDAKERARKAAACPSNVFISGSSGTGKEVFARAIHDMSSYSNGKFVCVNCSAIPESLLESELFGYEEGAFTDAQRGGKIGKFELAEGGTIFLDEIGDMPLHLQAKLLRVIQERTIEKVGSLEQKQIDVRIISATHRNLKEMIANDLFREDLYYRINVVPVNLPDLKDRREDIPIFINKFIEDFCNNFQKTPKIVSKKAMKILSAYEWPGNIRQLINVCEALVVLVNESVIDLKHLPLDIQQAANKKALVANNQQVTQIEEKEIELIQILLIKHNYNKSAVAREMGITRSTLYDKISRYQIE